uniref:PDZ domain-containing protein n=1 Tax=Electrophorus electricus TaxID=8005 RepID=A0AAY5EFS3_ELEEL
MCRFGVSGSRGVGPPAFALVLCFITLKRHKSNEGLGFSIRGGSEHGVGIYVSLVEPGSLAEKEGLRVGDQIMKVNDKVFDRVTHADAVKVNSPLSLVFHFYNERGFFFSLKSVIRQIVCASN